MPIEIKMPALSPTMEEGTLAKWLVKEGDTVKSGDIMAEIETDKATMEFEAVDEGTIAKIMVAEGSDGVKVGTPIALLAEEGEDASAAASAGDEPEPVPDGEESEPAPEGDESEKDASKPAPKEDGSEPAPAPAKAEAAGKDDAAGGRTQEQAEDHGLPPQNGTGGDDGAAAGDAAGGRAKPAADDGAGRVKASPLARRIAAEAGVALSDLKGSGPNGRIVKADVESAGAGAASADASAPPPEADAKAESPAKAADAAPAKPAAAAPAPAAPAPAKPQAVWFDESIPHEISKLSNIRKTIARRLTEAKQTIPHIYLTVDVRLDALLKLRGELNRGLEARGVKLSVNDLLIKALGVALEANPKCNVTFLGDQLVSYQRADVSVAVSTPTGLITPIVRDAANLSMSRISSQMKDLAARAKDGKLKPEEYQGGTASISNMGMFGITQFDAVINPPQGMILAVGAGEKRPVVDGDALAVATVMSATGSFDHRAIDGADGAALMKSFKALVENPLGMIA